MPKTLPITPFSEFRPDISDYDGETSKDITNVVPRGDGYGPFASLVAYTATLPGPCRGYFFARNDDGSISVFAGTATKLYQLNNTNLTWTDVSLSGGSYSALGSTANWQFTQFNSFVLAVQVNAVTQIFNLTSSSAFANVADGNCPQAAYITVVNQFVVLSGLATPNVYRIQWSGLDDVSSSQAFTSGINSSDFQDLGDGGIVRGVSGGEYGIILQDASIRSMIYAPGSPYVFGIERVSLDDGMFAPYSLIRSGDKLFWCSPSGFKLMAPGGTPTPIGKERVDRTFFADVDTGNLQLFLGANDPTQTRVYWAYKSINGTTGQFDKVLCYDWALDKWTILKFSGQYLASLSKPGITLEGVDAAYDTASPVNLTSISNASPAVFALNNHGLKAGQGIILQTTGTLPTGLSVETPYYVKSVGLTTNAFEVSATGGVGPLEGTAVNTSGAGSGTHSFILSSIETLGISSLDAISTATLSQLSGVTTMGALGFFTGSNLEATLETPEHGNNGQRIFIRGARIICDADTINVSFSQRESPQATSTYSTPTSMDVRGFAPARVSTRYGRGKIDIPSQSWSFAAGMETDVGQEGLR